MSDGVCPFGGCSVCLEKLDMCIKRPDGKEDKIAHWCWNRDELNIIYEDGSRWKFLGAHITSMKAEE